MDQKTKIHSELRKNESYIREKFENCADILIRPMRLGSESKIDCLMVYIEVAVSNMMLDDQSFLGDLTGADTGIYAEQQSGDRRCAETGGYGRSPVSSSCRKCSFFYRRI